MRLNTINLQVVRNLGNYESLRIGGEWTPDSNQTMAEAMAEAMAELNATADQLTGKKPAPAPAPATATDPAPAPTPAPAPEKPAVENGMQFAEYTKYAQMNAAKEGDTRELVTLDQAKKLNGTLGRIAAGVEVDKVFAHFRFDEAALNILLAFASVKRVTLSFGDDAFVKLVKAVEQQKDVTNIVKAVKFADENTEKAWRLANAVNN